MTSKLIPYRHLEDEDPVQRRIEELRPILDAARASGKGGDAKMPWGSWVGTTWSDVAPPRFVHDLIERLDRCENERQSG